MKTNTLYGQHDTPNLQSEAPIPRWFLRYFWLSGLFFTSDVTTPTVNLDRTPLRSADMQQTSRFERTYSYVVAFLTTIMAILAQMDYYGFFWKDIATLDFFVLIRLVNSNAFGYQVPLIFLSLIISRRAATTFRASLECTMPVIFVKEETARFRKCCGVILIGFIVTFPCVTIVGLVQHHWTRLDVSHSVVLGHQNVSGYAALAFNLLTMPACLNVDLVSQTACAVFIALIALGFNKVRHTIEMSYYSGSPHKELFTVVQKSTIHLQKLRNLTFDFNEAFGLLILLQCIRDLVAVVSFIALMLQFDGRLMDESLEDFQVRKTLLDRNNRWDYFFLTITLTKTVLRNSVCLYCNRSVRRITRLLQKMETEVLNAEVQSACSDMLSKIDDSTGTISAGGFALVNMNYVANVLSALVAYAVLVYQARDSKVAAQELAKVKTVQSEAEKLGELIRSLMTERA